VTVWDAVIAMSANFAMDPDNWVIRVDDSKNEYRVFRRIWGSSPDFYDDEYGVGAELHGGNWVQKLANLEK
jgi:hypothetical protein